MAEVVIIGAGVAGLAAAEQSRRQVKETVVFEAKDRWGGLLDHFVLDGFRFDRAVHFGFSSNEPFRALLEKTSSISHRPDPYNFESGLWLKHPVQNNLFPLPAAEKVEAVKSFIKRPDQSSNPDYRQWLIEQYGEVIAERYPIRYTEKYWTIAAEMMSTDWIGRRLYRPSLDEVLFGAMTDETPVTYYLQEMLYPRYGGFRSFLEPLTEGLDWRPGKKVIHIDPRHKKITFSDGSAEHYELLVSSAPLPELVGMIEHVPPEVHSAAESLWATSAGLVSLGLKKEEEGRHLWFYIYDRDILPARVHAPSLKSPDNAPPGCSSLQFEIYFSRHKPLPGSADSLIEHVVQVGEKIGLFTRDDIALTDFRVLPYANVVFDRGMAGRRKAVLDWVRGKGIVPVGRFGEWDYLWSDQSYLSGSKIGEYLDML